jgi:hypothetical protein
MMITRLLVLIALLMVLVGCGAPASPAEQIIGRWDGSGGAGFEFFPNGTMIQTYTDGNMISVVYTLSADGKTLTDMGIGKNFPVILNGDSLQLFGVPTQRGKADPLDTRPVAEQLVGSWSGQGGNYTFTADGTWFFDTGSPPATAGHYTISADGRTLTLATEQGNREEPLNLVTPKLMVLRPPFVFGRKANASAAAASAGPVGTTVQSTPVTLARTAVPTVTPPVTATVGVYVPPANLAELLIGRWDDSKGTSEEFFPNGVVIYSMPGGGMYATNYELSADGMKLQIKNKGINVDASPIIFSGDSIDIANTHLQRVKAEPPDTRPIIERLIGVWSGQNGDYTFAADGTWSYSKFGSLMLTGHYTLNADGKTLDLGTAKPAELTIVTASLLVLDLPNVYTRVANAPVATVQSSPVTIAPTALPTIAPTATQSSNDAVPRGDPSNGDVPAGDGSGVPFSVSASASAPAGVNACNEHISYEPALVQDGRLDTAWRVPGNGVGQFLQLDFAAPTQISDLSLVPGYAKIDPCDGINRFTQNRRVRSVRLTFSDGSSVEGSFTDTPTLQPVHFAPVRASWVKITILTTYPQPAGAAGRDFTPISEVVVNGTTP